MEEWYEDLGWFVRSKNGKYVISLQSGKKYKIIERPGTKIRRIFPLGKVEQEELEWANKMLEKDGPVWLGKACIYYNSINGQFEWEY